MLNEIINLEFNNNFLPLNALINGDCLNVMKGMPNNTIDLIIADPPYHQVCGDFDFGIWKDRKEYLSWCKSWLLECKRILKETGTIILWEV